MQKVKKDIYLENYKQAKSLTHQTHEESFQSQESEDEEDYDEEDMKDEEEGAEGNGLDLKNGVTVADPMSRKN